MDVGLDTAHVFPLPMQVYFLAIFASKKILQLYPFAAHNFRIKLISQLSELFFTLPMLWQQSLHQGLKYLQC